MAVRKQVAEPLKCPVPSIFSSVVEDAANAITQQVRDALGSEAYRHHLEGTIIGNVLAAGVSEDPARCIAKAQWFLEKLATHLSEAE